MLWLTPTQAQQLVMVAQAAHPQEACGLLAADAQGRIVEISPIDNIAAQPNTTYHMEPQQQARTMLRYHQEGWQLAGIYHSHPTSAPIPSPTDIQQAAYPHAAYLIISLQDPQKPSLAAWQIQHGTVNPLALHIDPLAPTTSSQPEPLSPPQKVAIILSIAVAFVVVVLYSISLLPPAPPIPGS